MNILGIIPARYGSSRFPGKPLAEIRGKTMVQRVYEQVKKAESISEVIVATDDQRIFNEVESFGGKVMLTSTNHLNGTSRSHEVFKNLDKNNTGFFQAIVNIQGDEPFIAPQQINQVCKLLIEKNADIATLAKKIESSEVLFDPNVVKLVMSNSGSALYFSRNPIPFVRNSEKQNWLKQGSFYKHIGIYGFSVATLNEIVEIPTGKLEVLENLEQLRWLENGKEILVDITDFESIGIDTPEDLKKLINNI
jgi:3-deoxy-manno-octulosonate cytidylyltransferase (CMP-KDO synthetase)